VQGRAVVRELRSGLVQSDASKLRLCNGCCGCECLPLQIVQLMNCAANIGGGGGGGGGLGGGELSIRNVFSCGYPPTHAVKPSVVESKRFQVLPFRRYNGSNGTCFYLCDSCKGNHV
jgi:hypothetical protein